MTAPARDELRRLHLINALFAHVTGQDLYLAEQIKSAITFSLAEFEQQTSDHPEFAAQYDAAFNTAAARLLEESFSHLPKHGFFHWDATRTLTAAEPLFARAELMTGLKRLAPFRESTLLVTNLRPALLPPDKRQTPRRKRDYAESLGYIRELAAARTAPSANLNLLFL
ncbi:hypothetical protein [Synoicihabitans lomoniglobus]|uniref:Uncharacterized protein n=1 Tax=Synoicihabitans lomoniglobus TaxID=2909285 RepID=A0AAF0CPN4_9BACT|nr:hypothetical protein [Opitutaceae bacterium LMO-M01]WED65659.1 hypothetical protein PXH66_02210 [Opitutaceae bacterium LMO-M01]